MIAIKPIGIETTIQHVLITPTAQNITTSTTVQDVILVPAQQAIRTSTTAIKHVLVITANQGIITRFAIQLIKTSPFIAP